VKHTVLGIGIPAFGILFGIGLMYSSFPHGDFVGEGEGNLFLGAILCAIGAAMWWHWRKQMGESLEDELKLAEDVVNGIKKVLSIHKFSDEEWSTTVIGFIAQGIEHHAAILLLLRSRLIGSGFALVRSVVEILVRGVWMTTCATDAQVKKFREQDKLDLSFGEMSDAIDKACGIDFFHDFKTKSWATLNSYTHTGILQLGRRFTGDNLEPSYKEGEQIEVLRTSTIAIVLLVRPFLMRHGQKEAAVEVDKLGSRLNRKK
jgi:hypothetical protein